MGKSQTKGRLLAIVTGAFSILIALAYLVLITVLDSRGPMLPPPQEALGAVVVVWLDSFVKALQLY